MSDAPSTQETSIDATGLELSVVMPCLNEADTLEACITKARQCMDSQGIAGEIIVADNGSIDNSVEIAERCGAVVVVAERRGYGSALMAGIEVAGGKFIIMGDADDSYDFGQLGPFVEKLRQGSDLVMGCRMPSGGGTIEPGAMPFLHRHVGNPVFTRLARRWFSAPIHDINCGLRGFTRELYDEMAMVCTGMEFANELVIKACLHKKKVDEVPVTLHRDGRVSHPPHLRTFRDGLRTLGFFLLCSPRWVFLVPGLVLMAIGVISFALIIPGPFRIGKAMELDIQSLLVGGIGCIVGYQFVIFAVFTKLLAMAKGLVPPHTALVRLHRYITVQTGVIAGVAMTFAGVLLVVGAIVVWGVRHSFGPLNPLSFMRVTIPGGILLAVGVQTIFASVFMSLLGLERKS
ncbi:MAG: glycosyltransferase family 2 protein [Phycisphaerae bacterium]|jgi:glycosyltransferase involved in cell wall biosynthesis|nr:glycosyltransferase family 2 protein [Phycisphaerae bacterium]MDP7287226.1 glycosyltransferase family 2 protein [Phycisphaerae bacterium]